MINNKRIDPDRYEYAIGLTTGQLSRADKRTGESAILGWCTGEWLPCESKWMTRSDNKRIYPIRKISRAVAWAFEDERGYNSDYFCMQA